MSQRIVADGNVPSRFSCTGRLVCVALLGLVAAGAHAASVYRCVDAHAQLAFQDTPCAVHAQQRKLDVQPLPNIGNAADVAAGSRDIQATGTRHATRSRWGTRGEHASPRRPGVKSETSWVCRAADGEVFYRHSRCPSSVPGDGMVRSRYAEKISSTHARGRHDAWSRVRVHGEKVSRTEACRRIRSPSAAGRDGHLRDEQVDTYARLTGHDPCDGA